MTSPILIPVDGSELSDRILGPIGPLLKHRGGSILLLRVVPPLGTRPDQSEDLDVAEKHLFDLSQTLQKQGFEVRTRLERGDPTQQILEVVEDAKASLLAMSTHGRTGASRLMRGSVAERILRKCPIPLLLCNPHAIDKELEGDQFQRILVPLDGSSLANEILPLVEELALAYGSHVTLLRVQPLIYTTVPSPMFTGELWNEEATRKTLEKQREDLAKAGIDVEIRATYGVESTEILDAAKEANLVAMTTHGRSGISRWWFGSVAESVVRHCPCPLLVLRSREG